MALAWQLPGNVGSLSYLWDDRSGGFLQREIPKARHGYDGGLQDAMACMSLVHHTRITVGNG
jgi:hypothetical protein